MIKCLPEEVRGRLRSGVALPSLQQCVEELVLNSIDAGATCVGVRMDMEAFKVQVVDNGSGMDAEDMERVGSRYHTSKCSSVADLEGLRWHGFRGEALASIVSLATLVEISSRTRTSVKTHVKVFKEGTGMGVFEAESIRPSAGTTVIVCNFFHNMPVRRRRVDAVLEGERIRHRVEAVALMHPGVSFTLKNDCTAAMMVQLPKARDTHHRFLQIHGPARAQKLRAVVHARGRFEVDGHLGREGHYNGGLQFLYVNGRLLLRTRIHKLLNALLRRLAAGPKADSPEETSVSRSPKVKRGQETYGVYVVNIKCPYSEYDVCLEPAKTLIEFKDWDGVLLCVEEAVKAFMRRENLVAVVSQEDLEDAAPQASQAQDGTSGQGVQGDVDVPTPDCSVGTKLASESVHRKCTDESRSSVCTETGEDEERQNESGAKESENYQIGSCDGIQSRLDKMEAGSVGGDEEEATTGSEASHQPVVEESGIKSKCANTASILTSTQSSVQRDLNQSEQTLSHIQEVDRSEQAFSGRAKVSVSAAYAHESLKVLGGSRTGVPAGEFPATKRKVSLDPGQDGSTPAPRGDVTAAVPSKVPRIVPSQKISAYNRSASLDKFRRRFLKPGEAKVPRCEDRADGAGSSREGASQGVATETQRGPRSPPAPSASPPRSGATSLAAKLCNLKQQTEVSRAVPEDGGDGVRDEEPGAGGPEGPEGPEPDPQSDWLRHYDPAVGKTVYVNRVTGLSGYEDPARVDGTAAPCTSDVTNLAVSVVSETGTESRCYPFQADLVAAFLPKSRPERVLSSGPEWRDDEAGDDSNSLSSLYSKWNNPVFVRPPAVGVDVSSGHADGLVVKIHNILFPYRFSKSMIPSMKVVNQVDKKFLACLINTKDDESRAHADAEGNLLVLVDQHAAHERVRLENLVADSYEEDPDVTGERRLCSSNIVPPLQISVTEEELRLLRSCRSRLRTLGLEVSFSPAADPAVFVAKVPLCFTEKESNEVRWGRPSIIKPIVEEYIREQTELLRSTGRVRGTLPLTVLKVLASLACHGAVKFNSALSKDECHSLVSSLSSCQLPFQCAHGRPSIVPLVDLLHLDREQEEPQKPSMHKLRRMYKAWELYGNR